MIPTLEYFQTGPRRNFRHCQSVELIFARRKKKKNNGRKGFGFCLRKINISMHSSSNFHLEAREFNVYHVKSFFTLREYKGGSHTTCTCIIYTYIHTYTNLENLGIIVPRIRSENYLKLKDKRSEKSRNEEIRKSEKTEAIN